MIRLWVTRAPKRRAVLDADGKDIHTVPTILGAMGLKKRLDYRVHSVQNKRDMLRYSFSKEHLEDLALAMPHATVSSKALKLLEKVDRRTPNPYEENPRAVPELNRTLKHHQEVAVAAITDNWTRVGPFHQRRMGRKKGYELKRKGGFLLLDGMGLGKTTSAIASLVAEAAFPALIVCPSNAKRVWMREFVICAPWVKVAMIDGTPYERMAAIKSEADVYVINFEALRLHPELAERDWECLVTDEFHRCKNTDAAQTQAWLNIDAKRELHMSGTPVMNSPDEIWPTFHRIDPKRWNSEWAFKRWLNITHKNKEGTNTYTVGYNPDAVRQMRAYLHNPRVSLRRKREDVMDDYPDIVPARRFVELSPEERRIYNQIRHQFLLELESGQLKRIADARVRYMRLKQAAFSPELFGGSKKSAKMKELRTVVEEWVANGEKGIIFSPSSKATRIIQRELEDYNPAYVDGSVTGAKRMAEVDRFNTDPSCWLYIGTIKANQEAITLSAATNVAFVDREWTPAANEQAIARSAAGGMRGEGVHQVTVIDICAYDTVDDSVGDLLESKAGMFAALVERVRPNAPLTRDLVEQLKEAV